MKAQYLFLFLLCICTTSFAQTPSAVLYPAEVPANLHFGHRIAVYNDYLAIGAPGTDSDANLGQSVYVFQKEGNGEWMQKARLTSPDTVISQCFGCSIALYGDYLLIGAPGDDENGTFSGAAYVFKKEVDEWILQAKLTPDDASEQQQCGTVALFENYALVGCATDEINDVSSSGSAYVFRREGDDWIEETKLIASDPTLSAKFGLHLSINNDYIFIGAPDALNDNDIATGAVYVFKKDGNSWSEQQKLFPDNNEFSDGFSKPILVNDTLFVATTKVQGSNGFTKGAAYLFKNNENDWTQIDRIIPNESAEIDEELYGWHFSGNYFALSNSNDPGAAEVSLFQRKENVWEQIASVSSPVDNNRFGKDLQLSNNHLIVGAWKGFYQDSIQTGAVYIYDLDVLTTTSNVTILQTKLLVSPNPSQDQLNISISSSQSIAIKSIALFDMNGQVIQRLPGSASAQKSHDFQLNTSQLPTGMYIVRLSDGMNFYQSRFVKAR